MDYKRINEIHGIVTDDLLCKKRPLSDFVIANMEKQSCNNIPDYNALNDSLVNDFLCNNNKNTNIDLHRDTSFISENSNTVNYKDSNENVNFSFSVQENSSVKSISEIEKRSSGPDGPNNTVPASKVGAVQPSMPDFKNNFVRTPEKIYIAAQNEMDAETIKETCNTELDFSSELTFDTCTESISDTISGIFMETNQINEAATNQVTGSKEEEKAESRLKNELGEITCENSRLVSSLEKNRNCFTLNSSEENLTGSNIFNKKDFPIKNSVEKGISDGNNLKFFSKVTSNKKEDYPYGQFPPSSGTKTDILDFNVTKSNSQILSDVNLSEMRSNDEKMYHERELKAGINSSISHLQHETESTNEHFNNIDGCLNFLDPTAVSSKPTDIIMKETNSNHFGQKLNSTGTKDSEYPPSESSLISSENEDKKVSGANGEDTPLEEAAHLNTSEKNEESSLNEGESFSSGKKIGNPLQADEDLSMEGEPKNFWKVTQNADMKEDSGNSDEKICCISKIDEEMISENNNNLVKRDQSVLKEGSQGEESNLSSDENQVTPAQNYIDVQNDENIIKNEEEMICTSSKIIPADEMTKEEITVQDQGVDSIDQSALMAEEKASTITNEVICNQSKEVIVGGDGDFRKYGENIETETDEGSVCKENRVALADKIIEEESQQVILKDQEVYPVDQNTFMAKNQGTIITNGVNVNENKGDSVWKDDGHQNDQNVAMEVSEETNCGEKKIILNQNESTQNEGISFVNEAQDVIKKEGDKTTVEKTFKVTPEKNKNVPDETEDVVMKNIDSVLIENDLNVSEHRNVKSADLDELKGKFKVNVSNVQATQKELSSNNEILEQKICSTKSSSENCIEINLKKENNDSVQKGVVEAELSGDVEINQKKELHNEANVSIKFNGMTSKDIQSAEVTNSNVPIEEEYFKRRPDVSNSSNISPSANDGNSYSDPSFDCKECGAKLKTQNSLFTHKKMHLSKSSISLTIKNERTENVEKNKEEMLKPKRGRTKKLVTDKLENFVTAVKENVMKKIMRKRKVKIQEPVRNTRKRAKIEKENKIAKTEKSTKDKKPVKVKEIVKTKSPKITKIENPVENQKKKSVSTDSVNNSKTEPVRQKVKKKSSYALPNALNIRKFACPDCGAKFKRNDHLKRHQLLHAEKSFECSDCGMKFYRGDKLKLHYVRHHLQNPKKDAKTVLNLTRIPKKSVECHKCGFQFLRIAPPKAEGRSGSCRRKNSCCISCGAKLKDEDN